MALEETSPISEEQDKKPRKGSSKKRSGVSLLDKIEKNPIKKLRELVAVSETSLNERKATWDRYRRKYRRGLHYLRAMESGVPLYFTNYIFATVEATKANLTRNLPTITARPKGFRDDLAADIMTRMLENALLEGGLKPSTREVVHHGLTASYGWFKVYFDAQEDKVVISSLPPDDVLVDAHAPHPRDARWFCHRRRDIPVEQIYYQYGTMPHIEDDDQNLRSHSDADNSRALYTSDGELNRARDVSETMDVWEFWIRSWEEDRENDWYIYTIAGDTVLREEYSVYEHNQPPFVPWFDVEDFSADNVYHRGVGSIEEIEPLQDRADALDMRIYKNISLLANRQRFVSAQSGLNSNMMDNTDGRTYTVNGDATKAVYYDAPPQLSREVYEYRDATEVLMQTVSGIFDVTQGRRPVGITAGRAIESLKDAAETRLSAKVETLGEALQKVGELALRIILQFYEGVRIIHATDSDEDRDFIVIDDYPDELKTLSIPMVDPNTGEPVIDPETGEPMMEEMSSEDEDEQEEINLQLEEMRRQWREENGIALVLSDVTYEWDIEVSTDGALPSARAERAQVASEFFRLGAIDREALLEATDYPQRHKILQRLAAEATGKDAGDPNVENGNVLEQTLGIMAQTLEQMGMPPEQIQQLVEAMLQQMTQGAEQPQTGQFQPQITM